MSYCASIYSHVYDPPITAEVSASKDGEHGAIVNSAPSELEIETQEVIDRLFRECFTSQPRGRATGG